MGRRKKLKRLHEFFFLVLLLRAVSVLMRRLGEVDWISRNGMWTEEASHLSEEGCSLSLSLPLPPQEGKEEGGGWISAEEW